MSTRRVRAGPLCSISCPPLRPVCVCVRAFLCRCAIQPGAGSPHPRGLADSQRASPQVSDPSPLPSSPILNSFLDEAFMNKYCEVPCLVSPSVPLLPAAGCWLLLHLQQLVEPARHTPAIDAVPYKVIALHCGEGGKGVTQPFSTPNSTHLA